MTGVKIQESVMVIMRELKMGLENGIEIPVNMRKPEKMVRKLKYSML